jgi:hypothetical protein
MDQNTLKTIPLFADLPRRGRRQVASWADEVGVPAGTALTKEGDHAREFCVIVSGSAELRRDGRPTAEPPVPSHRPWPGGARRVPAAGQLR